MRPDQQPMKSRKPDGDRRTRDGKRNPRNVSRDKQRRAQRAAKRTMQGR
jgi:hypothetical protein